MGDGLYKLLPTPDYDPAKERWEFPPGTIVRCETKRGRFADSLFMPRKEMPPPTATWKTRMATPEGREGVIRQDYLMAIMPGKEDRDAYVLYVYENGKLTHDYMLDTLAFAQDKAFEDFGIDREAWVQTET